jgi:hypothetical protein
MLTNPDITNKPIATTAPNDTGSLPSPTDPEALTAAPLLVAPPAPVVGVVLVAVLSVFAGKMLL